MYTLHQISKVHKTQRLIDWSERVEAVLYAYKLMTCDISYFSD